MAGREGFGAFGVPVAALWHGPDVFPTRRGKTWWSVDLRSRHPSPVFVEFADNRVVPIIIAHDVIAKIARDRHGASAVLMPETYGPQTGGLAEMAIAAMESGALQAEEGLDLIVELRQLKHVDPVLGVISAYLYDTLGDTDSIRRMAYYYARHYQPIPYDIALLGMLHGQRDAEQLIAHVPAVAMRKPRTAREGQHTWSYQATAATAAPVAGNWPWLRQGWSFLEDPTNEESTLILPELLDAMPHLTPARFTTMKAQGAQILARPFGLERIEI